MISKRSSLCTFLIELVFIFYDSSCFMYGFSYPNNKSYLIRLKISANLINASKKYSLLFSSLDFILIHLILILAVWV